jgi:hypothetical protein
MQFLIYRLSLPESMDLQDIKVINGSDYMIQIFAIIGFYLLPLYSIVFCLNLVSIFKKVKYEENTSKNTIWIAVSFTLIICTFASMIVGAS